MNQEGLIVRKAGPLTLIQDLGRSGYFRQGLTVGGPADRLSFQWANRLCGNRADTTALEIVVGGVELEATTHCQIAVAGGEGEVSINGVKVFNWGSHNLKPGEHFKISHLRHGMRIYLAVRGGLQVPQCFGSTATITREKIGGLIGEPLKTGDFLPVIPSIDETRFLLPRDKRPLIGLSTRARVIPGWHYKSLPRALRRDFFSTAFEISRDSNRMGVRLKGDPLIEHQGLPRQMISEGIIAGAVQIPPDGLPIIMLNDHQTMGGYPKIGTVIPCDLWHLSQMRPGHEVSFEPVSSWKAQLIMRQVVKDFESTLPEIA